MTIAINVSVVEEGALTPEQEDAFLQLAIQCFTDVTAEEVEEDFCRPPIARVLAYAGGDLVAGAEVFKRVVEYAGKMVAVGGFGPFTREDLRGQGIGTQVCRTAMDYLREQGCAIAFLSIGAEDEPGPFYARLRFYERLGFRRLPGPFVYANVRGELKEEGGGLIAPLGSAELFERVLRGDAPFALTPEPGYW